MEFCAIFTLFYLPKKFLLQLEQRLFHLQTAAVSYQRTIGADNAMAGDGNKNRVSIICHAHSAIGLGMANGFGNILIAARFAIGNLPQRLPNLFMK